MKKILVTGCSSGIGKVLTEKLLFNKNLVIGMSRRKIQMDKYPGYYHHYQIDFSQIDSLESALKKISKEWSSIDVLVCAAGYGKFAEIEQFSVSDIRKMLNVNFLSQIILIKTFLSQFKKNKKGHIILLGSECALEGQKKGAIYSATKFALRGFSQSLRKECAQSNVSVTLINPGLVDTPFFDELTFCPKIGEEYSIQPEQIANLIVSIIKETNNCVYEEVNLQPMKKAVIRKNKPSVNEKNIN